MVSNFRKYQKIRESKESSAGKSRESDNGNWIEANRNKCVTNKVGKSCTSKHKFWKYQKDKTEKTPKGT